MDRIETYKNKGERNVQMFCVRQRYPCPVNVPDFVNILGYRAKGK